MYGKVIRYANRDIIKVLVDGELQGFYKSTGKNSSMPDTWLPFDGVQFGWFVKDRFCSKDPDSEIVRGKLLYRFGTERLKQVSTWLGTLDIEEGIEVENFWDVNLFLEFKEGTIVFEEQ